MRESEGKGEGKGERKGEGKGEEEEDERSVPDQLREALTMNAVRAINLTRE